MHFFSFGINHHDAAIVQRDAYVLGEADIRALYRSVEVSSDAEYVLISTCNRTECYLHGVEADVRAIQTGIGSCANEPWPADAAFLLRDEEAVRHVLRVASGLDSMVLGDGQILGQVKEAYRLAVEEERVAAVLHRLMHTAFATAKRVLNETTIARGHASVAGTAVSIVQEALAKREDAETVYSVLVVGAGKMGRLVVEALADNEDAQISLTNRSCERANEVIERYPNLISVDWQDRYRALGEAHAVIVASAAASYVLEEAGVPIQAPGTVAQTLIVDLSIPRNADPAIGALHGYQLYDLDSLQSMIEDVVDLRRADIVPANGICDEMLADFVSWFFHHQAMQPAIHAILETFDEIRKQEIERHHHRFGEADYGQLDRITRSIMQKVLAVPVVRLKNVGPDNVDYVHGIKLLQLLFARESCEDPVSQFEELPESVLELLSKPEGADLSKLASCPFEEGRVPISSGQCPVSAEHTRTLRRLTLGTRKSALAMWQAGHVTKLLEGSDCVVRLAPITTKGDRILDRPLSQIEGKSLFTKELDIAILDGRVDFAVHSLKDLPTTLPEGLVLAAISKREDSSDAFVAHPSFDGALDELPHGAKLGTSSLRRAAQLKAWRPDLDIVPIRGNVDTRIAKLDESDMHGIVLAAAGLIRLELQHRIHSLFDKDIMLPAVGQGALGVVCAESHVTVRHILDAVVHDEKTAACVLSERAFLRCLEGSCRVPVGALAEWKEGRLELEGFVAAIDGQIVIREREEVDPTVPEEAGIRLAQRLLDRGAAALLEEARMIG